MRDEDKIVDLEILLVEEVLKQSEGNLILFLDLSSKVLKSLKKSFSELIELKLKEVLGRDFDELIF